MGVERDLMQLIKDRDISRAMTLFQDRKQEVLRAISEYNPATHDVMNRKDKPRKRKESYRVEKLPRAWQRYINNIAMFFLLGNPVRWTCENTDEASVDAFNTFLEFLKKIRFDTYMRDAKLLAGSETECAKLYHIFKDSEGNPGVKIVMLSQSEEYDVRPLFDQYRNLLAFGYGYMLNESGETVEHFDVETPEKIYRCKKVKLGWDVQEFANVTGKINVIYYSQKAEWDGAQWRIERDEMLDSRSADTNNYFADPIAKATADVIESMTDPESVGKMIKMQGEGSSFDYVQPPTSSPLKDSEKKTLHDSILQDTFTPDLNFENMRGLGTVSGEAIKRMLVAGYIKRGLNIDIYEELIDREKNLILAIMMKVTHIEKRDALSKLNIKFEFSEPFNDDMQMKWAAIGRAYSDGIISLETAVRMMAVANPQEELSRIEEEKNRATESALFPTGGIE